MPKKAIILVADDSAVLREFIRLPLMYAGHQALEAMDGLEAAGICQNQALDLIITDTEMPYLDGIGFIRKIKQEIIDFQTPILLLLEHKQSASESEARKLGIVYFLTKPFSVQKLMDKVNEILEN